MKEEKKKEVDVNEILEGKIEQDTKDTGENTKNTNDNVLSEVETLKQQLQELNDKYIRTYSEFDNYRKRTNKEKIDLITNANAGLIKDLLPVLDDFERAILNNDKAEDIEVLKEGFILIFNKLFKTLENKGLKKMEAKGLSFDSELHDAIANIDAPTPDQKGCIIDDVEKGYFLNDTIIRHAKVVVGQ